MQLLKIKEDTTLQELASIVDPHNLDTVLAVNNLTRTRNIGKAFKQVCNNIISNSKSVNPYDKASILNSLTSDSDIFEEAALSSDDDWKVMSALRTLPGMLKMPDTVILPDTANVLGNGVSIGKSVYSKILDSLKGSRDIDPGVFNEHSSVPHVNDTLTKGKSSKCVFDQFHIPWGQVVLYSSIQGETKDFPVYPEELSDGRSANYTQMPDMLYQYEPWQVYQSSGPRQGTYTFIFHRDMWTGDHNDGLANDLIRFCEANCYPEYKGSAVNTPTVTLYIAGHAFISGVLTSVNPRWSGPIGHDGWYLVCELELSFTEVSQEKLDYNTVRNKPIIG